MALETSRWDSAELLESPEEIAAYVEAAFEDGDPAVITHALGVVARAKGMSQVAREFRLVARSPLQSADARRRPEAFHLFQRAEGAGNEGDGARGMRRPRACACGERGFDRRPASGRAFGETTR